MLKSQEFDPTAVQQVPEFAGSPLLLGPITRAEVERLASTVTLTGQHIAAESELSLQTEGELADYLTSLDRHVVLVSEARNEIRQLIGITTQIAQPTRSAERHAQIGATLKPDTVATF